MDGGLNQGFPRKPSASLPFTPHLHVPQPHQLPNRRYFLKSAGITLALPLLESVSQRVLGAGLAVSTQAGAAVTGTRPLRMALIGNSLSFYQPAFWPKTTGRDFDLPDLLQPLAPHQKDISLLSGLDHGHKGGHFAIHSYLSEDRSAGICAGEL